MWITPQDRKTFQSLILLNELINGSRKFFTILNDDDKILDGLFTDLMAAKAVGIQGNQYVVTEVGQKAFDVHVRKFMEYLKAYDVFSYVDLGTAEFAFASYYNFPTAPDGSQPEWEAYKTDERFRDLRIAVTLFKKLNAAEAVFMSFINAGRFRTDRVGWQMDLCTGAIWDEIEAILDSAIKPDQIGEEGMVNMINDGSHLMVDLIRQDWEHRQEHEKKQAEYEASQQPDIVEETTTETVETIVEEEPEWVYYQSYYDPYYVPIFWWEPMIIWI